MCISCRPRVDVHKGGIRPMGEWSKTWFLCGRHKWMAPYHIISALALEGHCTSCFRRVRLCILCRPHVDIHKRGSGSCGQGEVVKNTDFFVDVISEWPPMPLCGAWWRISWVYAYRSKGHGFDSPSSRHVGTLSKSFTDSCLWRFSVKFRHSIRTVSGAPLSGSGLEEML